MDLMDYRRKIIANSPHLASASGAVATFSDGADLPLKSLNVDIEPVQDLHGYDSPWVAGGGKNLCPPLVDSELTSNGLTLTPNSDGTVRVHGTATNTSAVLLRMKTVSIVLGAGTYTFGIGVYPTNNKVYAQCVYSGGTIYARVAPATITFNDAVTITRIDIGVNAASGENIDITLYPQLEKGSTATAYAPYENICPISGWNAVNVKNGNTVIATISLGQTVYGGTLNPLTGVMTVDRAMVDLGTLNWTRINTQSPHWRFWALVTGMLKDSTLMSNQYAQITPSAQWTGAIGIATQLISGTPAVMVTDERYETAADFKTAMSGVQLVYELAAPFEIQLTPQQIRSLYRDNTILADTGNVALEYWAHP